MIDIKYIGRCYDVATYQAAEFIKAPTDIDSLMRSEAVVKAALIKQRQGIFNVRTRIDVSQFGSGILVYAEGEIHECDACGGQGHLPAACPYSKERT